MARKKSAIVLSDLSRESVDELESMVGDLMQAMQRRMLVKPPSRRLGAVVSRRRANSNLLHKI